MNYLNSHSKGEILQTVLKGLENHCYRYWFVAVDSGNHGNDDLLIVEEDSQEFQRRIEYLPKEDAALEAAQDIIFSSLEDDEVFEDYSFDILSAETVLDRIMDNPPCEEDGSDVRDAIQKELQAQQ